MVNFSPEVFKKWGLAMLDRHPDSDSQTNARRFKETFGTAPENCARLWNLCEVNEMEGSPHPKHLLWGLTFIKVYATESVHATIAGVDGAVDEDTFRKWSVIFVQRISDQEFKVVSFSLVHFYFAPMSS